MDEELSEKDTKDAWNLIYYFFACMEKYPNKEISGKATLNAMNHIADSIRKTIKDKTK